MLNVEVEKNKNEMFKIETLLSDLNQQKDYYNENKDLIENYEVLQADKQNLELEVNNLNKDFDKCQKHILSLYRENGILEERVEKVKYT